MYAVTGNKKTNGITRNTLSDWRMDLSEDFRSMIGKRVGSLTKSAEQGNSIEGYGSDLGFLFAINCCKILDEPRKHDPGHAEVDSALFSTRIQWARKLPH